MSLMTLSVIVAVASWAQSSDPMPGGIDAKRLSVIDSIVADSIAKKQMPGCVVCVGRSTGIVFLKAYGKKSLQPVETPMTVDTVFDMASVTKPTATATSVMILFERGKFRLDDPVARYIPEFGKNGKESITIAQLLTHTAGLIADNPEKDYLDGPEKAWERIFALKPIVVPGTKFIYSDVCFETLGKLVERLSGQTLDQFARENIFAPLGMKDSGYLPSDALKVRAAPTEQREGKWIQGDVHDPRAWRLGGVAGHAGLFSTAADLARYARMMLGEGELDGRRILGRQTVRLMTAPRPVSTGFRTYGFDMRTGFSSNRGETMSSRAFGHGGFTGTGMWIDPELDLFVIFLGNRVHPDGKGLVNPLIGKIGTIAASAVMDRSVATEASTAAPAIRTTPTSTRGRAAGGSPTMQVLCGIDVLEKNGFAQLQGRNIGLITNHTGRTRSGKSTVEVLAKAPGVKLAALFSPEHGIAGKLDEKVGDSRDSVTGLKIHSLYGETRKPSAESLKGVDTMVFDIQDVGCRFYTYISTLGNAMEAAAERKLKFVVLDRPNAINGVDIEGPILDAGKESFIAYHRIPVRHGMTVGELARMFKAERKIDVELEVVRVEGWNRADYFDATGLEWTNPSPNMRSLTQAVLYPGIGLLETTNLSVGRGTDAPFERIGAPWLKHIDLAARLNSANLPGVRFVPIRFTPTSSKFANKECNGVNIHVIDRSVLRPVTVGFEIARQLRLLNPKDWQVDAYNRLLGSAAVLTEIKAGKPVEAIEAGYFDALNDFKTRRKAFILYVE